jgi:hypothetical protein
MSLSREINEEAAARIMDLDRRVKRLETLEGAAGGGDFVLLEHQELSAAASEIVFDTISQVYKHLYIIHSTGGPTDFGDATLTLQFNGDTGANYFFIRRGWSNTPTETTSTSSTATAMHVGDEGRLAPSRFGAGYILIPDYTNTIKQQSVRAGSFNIASITFSNNVYGGVWKDTAAITDLKFEITSGDFIAGSIISLYGIR